MESFKFQLNIEENEEIKDNDTSIKLDNELKVISKKRNVTIYLNSKTNPASIIKEIKIKPDVVDSDDVEMLEDLILTCVNEALRKVDSAQADQFGKFNIPGLM